MVVEVDNTSRAGSASVAGSGPARAAAAVDSWTLIFTRVVLCLRFLPFVRQSSENVASWEQVSAEYRSSSEESDDANL